MRRARACLMYFVRGFPWNPLIQSTLVLTRSGIAQYCRQNENDKCLTRVISNNLRMADPKAGLYIREQNWQNHDDVIKWKHFPRYWTFVRGIHRGPVNSPHKGQWRGAMMYSLICVWISGWVNNREAGDLRHYRAHYDVSIMQIIKI